MALRAMREVLPPRSPAADRIAGPAYGERAPRKREGDTGSLSSHPSVAPVEHQSTAPARSARRGSLRQGRLNFRDAHADRGRTSAENWRQPIRWDRAARAVGERRRVFTGSMCDIFDNRAPEAWRADLWRLIAATPDLTWMLLTKRPQNIAGMLPPPIGAPAGATSGSLHRREPSRGGAPHPGLA